MEFSLRKVNALLIKEIKNLGKNPNVLFICLLPVLFSIMYSKLFGSQGADVVMVKTDILIMCLGMNLVLVSSFVIAMLIAEEKEKNTLRTLMLSGVSPMEFLAGKVLITLLVSEITNIVMFFILGIDPQHLVKYIILTTLLVISMIEIGSVVGIISPNQMSTGVVGIPVLALFLMVPIFAKISEDLKKIAEFLPNYHMNLMLEKVFKGETIGAGTAYNTAVILVWIVIAAGAFIYTYNKVGLDK